MARVTVANEGLDIHLSLGDEILALHGSFHIPYSHIDSVGTDQVPFEFFRGMRIGTNLPGIRTAGTFITGEGAIFYDMHDGSHCLTINLTHEHYRRVVVEVDADQDPGDLAEAIRKMIAHPDRR
jgi:hypothetical protein